MSQLFKLQNSINLYISRLKVHIPFSLTLTCLLRFSTNELEAQYNTYRSEQDSARQAMEKRHAEELAKLRSDLKDVEQLFVNKVNYLSWKLDLQVQQNQKKLNTLRTEKDEEVAKKQKFLEKILGRKQGEQEKLLSDQGSSKILQKKIEQLEKEQKDAKQKYEREKHELESNFLNQLQSLAHEKSKLETQFQQKQRALKKEITEKQAPLEESLRIKQLAESSKIEDNMLETRANFGNDCEYFHNPLLSKRSKQS